ncbi:DNA-directed RNA polymerase subunit P [Planctomycetes bacterium MalM25]|nr:DNA-directed RNA polymerase subunit P [Planctomycetes bacterium MalM25]
MTETTIHFACDACGKGFNTPSQHAGRSTACPGCGATLTVPAESTRVDPLADLVGFSCGLCGTRMDVPSRYIGRKVKCPDCHKATVVPAPEAPAPKRALRDFEAYDVYEGEQQPRGIDLARAAPKSVHFICSRCQTHLTAPIDQVGQPITCPDCGAKTPAPRPRPEDEPKPIPIDAGYDVEAAVDTSAMTAGLYEEYTKQTPAGYRDMRKRAEEGGKRSGRPEPKGLPVVTDLLGLFRSRSFLAVWLALSAGVAATSGSLLLAATMLGMGAGPFGVLAAISFFAMGAMFGLLAFAGLAAYGLAVFSQSCEGAPHVEEWPLTIPTEWWGAALQLLLALVVSAASAGGLAALIDLGPAETGLAVLVSLWLVLPWVLLSQIDSGSMFGVFSPRLLRTLWHAPFSWIAFYSVSALGAGLWAVSSVLLSWVSPYLAIAVAPLTALAALQYAWLLGRLAWVIAAATPDWALNEPAETP